jgi:UDP-glucose 4-epimerase
VRVLVIGGGGLLGTHLIPKLKDEGHEIAICDNLSGCPRLNTDTGVRIFTSNVTDLNSTRQAFKVFKPEIVIFAAAHHFPRDIIYNFFDDVKLVVDSANVLASLLTREVKHVYFCSSSEVYGGPQPSRPLKETRKIEVGATHHGVAKLAAEKILQYRCRELNIGYTSLRIFDMFGPRCVFCARTGIISSLIDSFNRGTETVGLVGADRLRDFIHVEDVSKAIVSLIGTDFNGIVNIGSGKGTTLIQVVKALAKVMKITQPPMVVPDGPTPTLSAVADTSILTSVLPGWKPAIEVTESLADLVSFRLKAIEDSTNPLAVLNATRGL